MSDYIENYLSQKLRLQQAVLSVPQGSDRGVLASRGIVLDRDIEHLPPRLQKEISEITQFVDRLFVVAEDKTIDENTRVESYFFLQKLLNSIEVKIGDAHKSEVAKSPDNRAKMGRLDQKIDQIFDVFQESMAESGVSLEERGKRKSDEPGEEAKVSEVALPPESKKRKPSLHVPDDSFSPDVKMDVSCKEDEDVSAAAHRPAVAHAARSRAIIREVAHAESYVVGPWIFFSMTERAQGLGEGYEEARKGWKVFLNPTRENFYIVFERALTALASAGIEVMGKITQDRRRKSSMSALDDPCEPKILLYVTAQNQEEAGKKLVLVMKALEGEFRAEEMASLACSEGQRERSDGVIVPQRGFVAAQ